MSFNKPTTTEIYTLSLHDALPISPRICSLFVPPRHRGSAMSSAATILHADLADRSEEHTSELQSRRDLVCRLLLEKKNFLLKYTNSSRTSEPPLCPSTSI